MNAGKYIVIFGIIIVIVGLVIWRFGNIFSWFGNLPGDIKSKGENSSFYFPVVSCMVISIVLSLLMWVIRKLGS
jgi:H+/Cl- antiporter ClcA